MNNLTLCMIVRDAAADLPRCLESVRGVVDDIVVADTGSADPSAELAASLGARVVRIPWEDDFARARNQALEHVRTAWVLVLDADERLDPGAGKLLPGLLDRPGAGGYITPIRNYVTDPGQRLWDRPARPNDSTLPEAQPYPAYVEHENVRLFRRRPEIRFVGRVHESVGPSIEENGLGLERAGLLIHHFGLAADPATRARKNRFYRELGRRKVQEMPGNAQAHFELGLVELDNFHNDAEALGCFERACRLNPGFGVSWFFAAIAQMRLGRPADALGSLKQARARGHADLLVTELEGDAHYNLGRFAVARACYKRALAQAADPPALESKLGLAEVRVGAVDAGLARMKRAVEAEPERSEIHDRLIVAAAWSGRLEDAARAAEAKLRTARAEAADFLRAAAIHAQIGALEQAEGILARGAGRFPDADRLHQALREVRSIRGH